MSLPPESSLSPAVITYLNTTFHPTTPLSLSESTRLVTELDSQCAHLTQSLSDLTSRLHSHLLSYASFSDHIHSSFHQIHSQLSDLNSHASSFSSSDGMVAEELPALAKEVARVEMVRNYAETALKLDGLVGEIEEAVSLTLNKKLKKSSIAQSSEELRVSAISSLKLAEDVLCSVTETSPQWSRLISAADHRVDRALAILRPQAIADHRALLASIGWPPPLSTLSSSNVDANRSSDVTNPLSAMDGELKQKYCEDFLALCSLQELQQRRKSRQLKGFNSAKALHQPLWAIEELVSPLALASHHHFQKWNDKPEFIFALVYKTTRDYIDTVDELLQPLVDEAMLIGYSCREEWVSAVVTSLSTYLAKEICSGYVSQLSEEIPTDFQLQTKMSFLHLVDLMISFDKRIQALAGQSEILDSVEDYSLLKRISSLSVFCDRPDWLDIWAEIELANGLEKLKPEMEDDRNWAIKNQGAALFPGSEECKAPAISSVFLRHLSSVIDRCRSLPALFLRARFIRLVGAPIIQTLMNCLLSRCLEAEGLTALADDDALSKVITSVNTGRHLESVLGEWSEDVFFLELGLEHDGDLENPIEENTPLPGFSEGIENGALEEEIRILEEFRREWVDKISNVILRGFDAQVRDYLKNKKQWQEQIEEGWTVTKSLVVSLDYLQGKLSTLEVELNGMDFAAVWRSLASSVDRLIFHGIFLSNAKFYGGGVEKLGADMGVLFSIFRTWCIRPEGFFPRISEGLKLLKMEEDHLHDLFSQGEGWIKRNGIRHLSLAEAEKIAKCRVFK